MIKSVIQRHHIMYKEKDGRDWIVPIYKGEHWAITQLQRRKKISLGFIQSLYHWIDKVKPTAIDLELELKGGENGKEK